MEESETSHEITALLRAWSQGNQAALESLAIVVDRELHRIARHYLKAGGRDNILDSSAIINETYLHLIHGSQPGWQDRAHFYAVCAKTMRRILVDHVRARQTAKRGGGGPFLPLIEAQNAALKPTSDLEAIDEALEALAQVDWRKGRVVELRFFGGLTTEETAEVLQVSVDMVQRDWRLAKAWLMRRLGTAEAS